MRMMKTSGVVGRDPSDGRGTSTTAVATTTGALDTTQASNCTAHSFSSFAYQERPPVVGIGNGGSSDSAPSESRWPTKDVLAESKRVPAPPKQTVPKRRISESDDEGGTSAKQRVRLSDDISEDGWLETAVKPGNKIVKIAKKAPVWSEDEDEIVDTPERKRPSLSAILKKSTSFTSLLDKPHDGLDDLAARRASSMCGKVEEPIVILSDDQGEVANRNDVDNDDSDTDSDHGAKKVIYAALDEDGEWRDTLTKDGAQKQAANTLKLCRQLSSSLQASLREWKSGKTELSNTSSSSISNNGDNCVDLVAIKTGANLITEEHVQSFAAEGTRLKPYQLVGVNWLKLLHQNQVNGVLADDMGLGKTIQTIIFLGWLKAKSSQSASKRSRKAHLVVVPASTLSNWQNEFRKFCPLLRVVTYHGSQAERTELRYTLRDLLDQGAVDVVLCTYTLFEREATKIDRKFLGNLSFNFLVLDEAHCIKNSSSARFEHLNRLHTKHRLLLSGTPVQNDLSELLALLSFLMKNIFPAHHIDVLLESFGWEQRKGCGANGGSSASSGISSRSLASLRSMLAPFVLRRLKRDVLDQLTEKLSVVERMPMTDRQSSVYSNILLAHAQRKEIYELQKDEQKRVARFLDGLSPASSSAVEETTTLAPASSPVSNGAVIDLVSPSSPIEVVQPSSNVLPHPELPANDRSALETAVQSMSTSEANHLFTALRKAANHPLLLRIHYKNSEVLDKIAMVAFSSGHFGDQCDLARVKAEIETFSDFDIHQLCLQYPSLLGNYQLEASTLYESPKMEKLRKMLPNLQQEGHRMLIFSQWTRILDLLEVLLEDMQLSYLRLDGSTPVRERQALIDTFTSDNSIPVFLLSTKAGGLGINLTAADTVILHDLDFNPENDRQAEDRCHRIGQSKDVKVFKLVTANSVDEDIFSMGERKRELSQRVLSDNRSGSSASAATAEGDASTISKILQNALSKVLIQSSTKLLSPDSVVTAENALFPVGRSSASGK